MIQKKWTLGTTALMFALGATATTMMQPTMAMAAKAGKGAKTEGAKRERPIPALTPKLLGEVLGQPLTEAQTKEVEDAQQAYLDSVAKTVGLTSDELKTKVQDYHKGHKTHKADEKAGTVTPPPVAQ